MSKDPHNLFTLSPKERTEIENRMTTSPTSSEETVRQASATHVRRYNGRIRDPDGWWTTEEREYVPASAYDAVVAERDQAMDDNLRIHREKVAQYERACLLEVERDRLRQRVERLEAAVSSLMKPNPRLGGNEEHVVLRVRESDYDAAGALLRLALSGEK